MFSGLVQDVECRLCWRVNIAAATTTKNELDQSIVLFIMLLLLVRYVTFNFVIVIPLNVDKCPI